MTVRTLRRPLPDGAGGTVSAVIGVPDGFRIATTPGVVLAHGAGNDMENPLLVMVQRGLADAGVLTMRFNFPYKERGGRAPDRAPVLEACYRAVLAALQTDDAVRPGPLVIGGKSLGARMATHLAATGTPVAGVLCLGYPLHPAGRPDKLRVAHLPRIPVPILFLAGTRDSLCRLDLLEATLPELTAPTLHVVADGDHSFRVRKRSGRTPDEVDAEILAACTDWLGRILPPSP